jgi:hypothetical protein
VLEISDVTGNGLRGGTNGSDQVGSWKMTALYEENNETELASGGADFSSKVLVDFVVENRRSQRLVPEENDDQQSNECLSERVAEERSLGPSSGIVCDCVKNVSSLSTSFGRSELSCFDTNTSSICASNWGACGDDLSLKCCGNRRCSNGRCRFVSQGRDDKRIPLLMSEDGGSEGTVRGSRNGGQR